MKQALTKIIKQFGNNLRAKRLKAGLSQEALAQLAELHRTYVGSVERGERNISLLNIVKLAKALGIPATNLLKGV
jgi:transcriptional regulator with XRE-family HTH domain